MILQNSQSDNRNWRGRYAALVHGCLGVLCLLAVSASVRPLHAQFGAFGKNKVQYEDFDWKVMSGPRVDVFFYPEEEELARVALSYAEASFDTLVTLFRHRPFRRVPLIIYSSHQHFEQTNVTQSFLPEGVAGFTEFLKRRIALPFNGNYDDFRHTIRHELVHFFQLSKLTRVLRQNPRARRANIPLWWSEGLAERWSSEQDADDDMFIRDLVLNRRMPPIRQLNYSFGFIAYPLGGEFHKFLGERYGYGRVADFYDSVWKFNSFDETFYAVYGVPIERAYREFRYELEKRYFNEYDDRRPIALDARVVVKDLPAFKPVVHRDSDGELEAYFMSPGTGYTTIYRVNLDGRPEIEKVVQGERSEQFESLHFFYSRLDVGPNGNIAFVSKYLAQDALFIYDPRKGKIVGRYQFPNLVALQSPSWSPDGRKVVFSGLAKSGFADLYVLDFERQEHRPLTEDRYNETDPDWSPDGRYIVFSSNRTTLGSDGARNLFLYDLDTGSIDYLTYGPWRDVDPRWSPDGRNIAFTSSRNGIYDLYIVDREGRGGRLTGFTAAVFDADWTPAGDALVFSAFEEGTFNIYYEQVKVGEEPAIVLADPFEPPDAPDRQGWVWEELHEPIVAQAPRTDYKPRFGVDVATGGAMVSQFGAAQGAQVVASDMLGNQMLFFGVAALQANDIGDAVSSLSGRAVYLNLSRRVNWGVGVFRLKGRFFDTAFRNRFQESSYGMQFLASYPFSKFRRIDLQTTLERSDREDSFDVLLFDDVSPGIDSLSFERTGVISRTAMSYVMDNTLWLPTGPIDGLRWNLTGGLTTDLTKARAESYQVMFDLRRYFRTSLFSAYSVRLFGYWSDGAIPQRIPLGGSHSLRLFPYLGLFGSRAWMLNQEWRFPITHAIALAFPFGTVRFPGVQGGLFLDLAQVWREDQDPLGVWGSYGLGLRMPLLFPLILRLDLGKRFKIGDLPTSSFNDFGGFEVDFFLGVNY